MIGVLFGVYEWKIVYKDVEQTLDHPEGMKLIIPSFSIKLGQTINIKANIVPLKECDVIFPSSNMIRASHCYRIQSSGSFDHPIQVCLKHDTNPAHVQYKLKFLISKNTSPPYTFDYCQAIYDLSPQTDIGILHTSEFSNFIICWITDLFWDTFYSMNIYHTKIDTSTWKFFIFITTKDKAILEVSTTIQSKLYTLIFFAGNGKPMLQCEVDF